MSDASQFRLPQDLRASVDTEIAAHPAGELFLNPSLQPLRDKWAAARFGLGYEQFVSPCEISVNASSDRKDVDFLLRAHGRIFCFQTAETMEPGRKRSDEYRIVRAQGVLTKLVDPEIGRKFGPNWIANTIQRKVAKNYAGAESLELLVYANFMGRDLTYEGCREAASPFQRSFASIWVVADYFLGSLFSRPDIGEMYGWGKFLEHA